MTPDYPARRRLAVARAFRDHAARMAMTRPDLSDLDLRDFDDRCEESRRTERHQARWRNVAWMAEEEVRVAEGLLESYGKPAGTRYYVSARQYEDAVVCAGPFLSHETALRAVPRVRALARELYPATFPCAWGTCSVPPGEPDLEVNERINTALNAPPPPPPEAPRKRRGRRAPDLAAP